MTFLDKKFNLAEVFRRGLLGAVAGYIIALIVSSWLHINSGWLYLTIILLATLIFGISGINTNPRSFPKGAIGSFLNFFSWFPSGQQIPESITVRRFLIYLGIIIIVIIALAFYLAIKHHWLAI